MATDLKLPLLGDVMREGTLAAWLKPDGAHVERGEPVYQLETDKVAYAVEAPVAGVLRQVVSEGAVVPVGTVVGQVLESEASEVLATPTAGEMPATAAAAEVRASPAARRAARQLGVDLSAVPTGRRLREADIRALAERASPQEVLATPAARRLARVRGIDLSTLNGGSHLLRERDIPESVGTGQLTGRVQAVGGSQLVGRRRVIAERMLASLREMAQLTVSMEVDFTAASLLRSQLRQLWDSDAPTITDLVARAAILALASHPSVNATLEDSRLLQHSEVHLGLAVDADEGLIVPVIRDAHALSLRDLANRTREAAERARQNTLGLDDLQGGTFTITTLGQLGVDFFTPIVNPPQVAILGIGRVFPKLVRENGEIQDHQAMYLNLSFDHRALDGAPAARYLQEVKRLLELPASLIV